MSQTVENKCLSLEDILEILRSEAQAMPPSPTSSRYLRALQSLESSVFSLQSSDSRHAPGLMGSGHSDRDVAGLMGSGHSDRQAVGLSARDNPDRAAGLSLGEFPVQSAHPASSDNAQRATHNALSHTPYSILYTSLTDWLVNQWLMSSPFSTASLYLDIISSLYGSAVKAGRLPKTAVFSELKARLKALGPDGWKSGIDDEIFDRALRLTKNAARLISDDAIAADLILLSLTNSLRPLEDLALLKKEDLMGSGHSDRPSLSKSDRHAAGLMGSGHFDRQAVGLSARDIVNGRAVYNRPVQSAHPSSASSSSLLSPRGQTEPTSPRTQPLSPSAWSNCPASEDLRLKTEDLAVIRRHLGNARRKYIFQLRQSERTPAQLKKHISKIVNALFKRARLPQATDPMQTVEALWAYAALRSGIPASQLVAHLGHAPLGLPILKLSFMGGGHSDRQAEGLSSRVNPDSAVGLSLGEFPAQSGNPASEDSRLKTEDLAAIGRVFLENPPRWYAMSLRPGVRFTQVCRRIQLLSRTQDSRLKTQDLRLFYPCEEIARAIGKKIVVKQRPFIHSVVFFRARLTDIGPLFAKIGDLAWCYRQSSRPGAPYADISERQFQLFQQTIATFTPDFEVASTGELELKKDDRVQILGGLFAGHEATFDSIVMGGGHPDRQIPSEDSRLKTEDSNASGVVYRLNIIGENGIEWRINVDSRLAAPKS